MLTTSSFFSTTAEIEVSSVAIPGSACGLRVSDALVAITALSRICNGRHTARYLFRSSIVLKQWLTGFYKVASPLVTFPLNVIRQKPNL
jgi:hypothetical protein